MTNKNTGKVSPARCFAWLAVKICILVLFVGCARLRPGIKSAMPAEAKPGIEIHTQYAISSDTKLGYNTFEVYIANNTASPIVFSGAEINGKSLPKVYPKEISKLLSVKLGEGDEIQLTESGFPEDSPVTWWQYYPCNEVGPGEAVEFQVNFKAQNTGPQKLRLLRHGGLPISLTVPRFRQPEKRISAITYSLDGKRMFVQYVPAKCPLRSLSVNGKKMRDIKILKSMNDDAPALVAFNAPFELKNGALLHTEAEFEDGVHRAAIVRVVKGIVLDAALDNNPRENAIRQEYGLDAVSRIELLPFDVTCGDTTSGKQGMSGPLFAEKRRDLYGSTSDRLAGLGYCTAMYPALWNIYGQIADVVFAKPYRLNWGRIPLRFIEEEEECILKTRKTSEPKPFLWIPERFRKGRRLEAGEFRVLSWVVLADGGKGIRYHFWKNDSNDPFTDCRGLGEEITKVNTSIRLREKELSPLVPVRAWMDEKQKVKIYESWSGDEGVLIVVRNLDYVTDKNVNQSGQLPRFHVNPKENVKIEFSLPIGVRVSAPKDLLSDDQVKYTVSDGKTTFTLRCLDGLSAIWFQAEH